MHLVHGIIAKGMGEGQYFMSMPHYKSEIKRALGFVAFAGTLNIKTDENWMNMLSKPIPINGYKKEEKVFGGAKCYLAQIEKIDGAIIIPDLTKHKNDVIEFIAPFHVKSTLNVKDGDKIVLKIK